MTKPPNGIRPSQQEFTFPSADPEIGSFPEPRLTIYTRPGEDPFAVMTFPKDQVQFWANAHPADASFCFTREHAPLLRHLANILSGKRK